MCLTVDKIFDEYPNPVYIVKPIFDSNDVSYDFRYIYVNKAFALFLGLSVEELKGNRFLDVFREDGERVWLDLFASAAVGRKHAYYENVSTVINKKLYTEVFHVSPDLCGCIIHDFQVITDSVQSGKNKELWHKANYDYLTGFYNRFYLNELEADISNVEKTGITFLDINNLKRTNDGLGHAAGDKLIVKIADTIRDYYKGSMVFRLGGDEFVIITNGLDRDAFLKLSERNRALFEENNLAALGYCFYDKIENLQDSIDYCDSLMYERKKLLKECHSETDQLEMIKKYLGI
jgi:diguanylate cyclase (GGDEF)-like protein